MAGASSNALKVNYANNKFKYNGKELQNKEFSDGSGLDWDDYGFRMYDGQIGRFFNLDRYSEKFGLQSPFAYASNNPINFIDKNGNGTEDPIANRLGQIAKVINDQANAAWQSGLSSNGTLPGGNKPRFNTQEKGFTIVEKDGQFTGKPTQTGSTFKDDDGTTQGNDIVIRNDASNGEKRVADLHTHQQKDGSGTPQSPDDVMLLRNEKTGFAGIVEAGDKRYALVVVDADKAKQYLDAKNTNKLQEAFASQYENSKNGNEANRTVAGIMAMIGDGSQSGVALYVTTDKNKTTFSKVESQKPSGKTDEKKPPGQ